MSWGPFPKVTVIVIRYWSFWFDQILLAMYNFILGPPILNEDS